MTPADIHPARIQRLNDHEPARGAYVLYWMQQSQRAACNHALEFSIDQANALGLPLLVGFGLMDDYPEANERHYAFMLEGLRATEAALSRRGIGMTVQHGAPAEIALRLGKRASLVVCDRGYLRHQKAWRAEVARAARCSVVQVETDVVVPVETASEKMEIGARTLRPRIRRQLDNFLVPLRPRRVAKPGCDLAEANGLDLRDVPALCRRLKLDRSVAPVSERFCGGTAHAERIFRDFLRGRLRDYAEHRSQPQTNDVSHMSKYLHYGQVSPLWLALTAREHDAGSENVQSFLDELIVRRELAMNFVHFCDRYDSFACLPRWARETLDTHAPDDRPHLYTREQLEAAETHDPYWNAAMREMRATGYLHNHMRMYWGKKILEWSASPHEAHATALALNNRWLLDGRDPVSFANIAWVFGLHDRPWGERAIYGKVRCMTAGGLERKCDIRGYV